MALKPHNYKQRLIDPIVSLHLEAFGAVEIAGTMWSGKTWTSLAHANSVSRLGDPALRQIAEISLDTVLEGEAPHAIDEWQEMPQIWDAVRAKVDDAAGKRGLYILTGSSRPAKSRTHHTGSGRISRLRMWPMSLYESGASTGAVSLSALFDGRFEQAEQPIKLQDIARLICRGGWPGAMEVSDRAAALIPMQYIDALAAADSPDAPENEAEQLRFLRALARNIGSAVTIETLAKDMGYATEGNVTDTGRNRVKRLLAYFANRFVIDSLGGWDAPIKSPQRLRTKPRYDFADPSLPAALLGADETALMGNAQLFGQLFEQLCLRDLKVYSSCMENMASDGLRYYRDADGLEVDAILQLRDGRWGAIEIKLGANKVAQAEASLLRLQRKVAANKAAQNPAPSFLMVLVGKSDLSYRTESGVYVVPITQLTA